MNDHVAQEAHDTFDDQGKGPSTLYKMTDDERRDYDAVRAAVAQKMQETGWSMNKVAIAAGVKAGTFNPWYYGTSKGVYPPWTARLKGWLDGMSEGEETEAAQAAFEEPDFVETPTAKELLSMLIYAQNAPAIVVATLGSGMGKTTVARHVASQRPHVYRVVMHPKTSSPTGMLWEIAQNLWIDERRPSRVVMAIGEKLKRNGKKTLLIIDEAQNLSDEAVNQLRHFYDEYRTGIALLGNDAVYSRFGKQPVGDGGGQIHRRIGKRLRRLKPQADDIKAYLDAWNFTDPDVRKLLTMIGNKPGAIGQIAETLRYAAILVASRPGSTLTADDVRQAWAARGTGDWS